MIFDKYVIIRNHFKTNLVKRSPLFETIHFLFLRFKYKIGVYAFLDNKLFDSTCNHDDFYMSLHTYIHSWNHSIISFYPNASISERRHLRIKYIVYKFVYPGLDAEDFFRYKFYMLDHKRRKTFITEGFHKKMVKHFNPINKKTKEIHNILNDKSLFNAFFSCYLNREWISSRESDESIIKFVLQHKKVIVKPSFGGGGKGIFVKKIDNETDAKDFVVLVRNLRNEFVVEELIQQNKKLMSINNSSVNTIRIYTLVYQNSIKIIGGTLRVGNGSGFTDNYSSGNYAATIDVATGKVNSNGVSQYGDDLVAHPKSGVIFKGFKIPAWEECCSLVGEAHSKIKSLRYIGWDVAINDKNQPLLIEGNSCAGVELQQHPGLVGKKPIYLNNW